MGGFKVKESSFKTPPEDSYLIDLVWIEKLKGENGEYYRWHWAIANTPEQKAAGWAGIPVSSQTSLFPTFRNKFGQFYKVLTGKLEVDVEGTTEDLAMSSFRVKGFVEHNKRIYDGEEVIFCNVNKLIEGTAKRGEGIGYQGAGDSVIPSINEYLAQIGKPLLTPKKSVDGEKKSEASHRGETREPVKENPPASSKKRDIPW